MNRDSLQLYFLGGQSTEAFIATLTWGLIGASLSMLLELITSTKVKRTGGFKLSVWFQDNIVRLIATIIVVLIGSVFGDKITGEVANWGALLIGFFTDKSIEALIKFKSKVNLENVFIIFKKK